MEKVSPNESEALSLIETMLEQAQYDAVLQLCQEKFLKSGNPDYVWCSGIALLLQENEEAAQLTWLSQLSEGSEQQTEQWSQNIFNFLISTAIRQEKSGEWKNSWILRCHAEQFLTHDISNKLEIVQLMDKLEIWEEASIAELNLPEAISSLDLSKKHIIEQPKLSNILEKVLEHFPFSDHTYDLAKACLEVFPDATLIDVVFQKAIRFSYSNKQPLLALALLELCNQAKPNNIDILRQLIALRTRLADFKQAIQLAKQSLQGSQNLEEKVLSSYTLLKTYIQSGSAWFDALAESQNYKRLLSELFQIESQFNQETVSWFSSCGFVFPYLQDNPTTDREYINNIGLLCERKFSIPEKAHDRADISSVHSSSRKLRIGYISYCLRRHSVGWLTRSLFEHHNREDFEILTYLVNASESSDSIQDWYEYKSDVSHRFSFDNAESIANQIIDDKVDILIDLDSITIAVTCEVMCRKPAPIQATWLGWDASGIPSIDYFIADPYVLPSDAEKYYSEKIWRLPSTYLAVDGFEVDPPSLTKASLNIPENAVVYFSAQNGMKRNPEMLKLQLQIIREVSNSYFLLKGLGDQAGIKTFIYDLASQVGVKKEQLIFLNIDKSSEIHRGNLAVADIVLDTYPYNGATTTMEALWMERPIVTKVGQQFAARNSYTMLTNAGISEGIAWNDAEYLEWGIRMGRDMNLRKDIAWKLKMAKRHAPLWNGEKFTRDMESAYRGMWNSYTKQAETK